MVADILRTRSTAEWLTLFEEADIPAMPLNTLETLADDPQLTATGYFKVVEHPSEGTYRQMAPGSVWTESPPSVRRHAPRLGEHSAEVLREIGYADADIAALAQAGATRLAVAP